LVKLLGGRTASAVIGLFMLAITSSASAQDVVGAAAAQVRPAVVATVNAVVTQTPAAPSVTVKIPAAIATEAAWLFKGGWGLDALVQKYATNAALDEQTNCLATAVYFEARGETVEGQLAVARVVMNRAASGRYPPDWCGVVKQHAQFSFVRHGAFPYADIGSAAWQRAEAIAQLAAANIVPSVDVDVLWYHATYVAPSWGHRLSKVEKIGAHIFYRA
jgi:spore germination cell wall hydrolase CwlJ-like protein